MNKLIRRILGREDSSDSLPGNIYRVTGTALIFVGLAVFSPGPRDALISFVNKYMNLGLSLDAPWWTGLPVIGLGAIFFGLGFVTDRSGAHKGQFVAIRHQSFQPLAGNLPNGALPKRMRRRLVQVYDCDLSPFLTGGNVDPFGAVRCQERLAGHIAGIRRSDANAAFGYYGIVHIPYQFLAGCSISTYPEVILFELDRNNGKWSELKTNNGPDLKPKVIRTLNPSDPSSTVIRIEVSYPIVRLR